MDGWMDYGVARYEVHFFIKLTEKNNQHLLLLTDK